jgi:hypothetical protein
VLEVIDGQQRLATTTLALASMKKRVEVTNPNLGRALDAFLIDIDPDTLEPSPKMRLNTADATVFHDLVAEGRPGKGYIETRPSHQNLKAAFDEASLNWRRVSQPLNPNDQVKILQKWMNFIRYNAKVILLKVPSSVNAFKMFETLNDRGLKTSQADLVKNYILGQSGEEVNKSQEMWGYVKGSLESVAEEDTTVNFLRQALICKYGYIKEAHVYDRVQATVRGRQSAYRFLTELEILAKDYAGIFNFGSERWSADRSETRRSLEVLEVFDIKPLRPLLLAASKAYSINERSVAFGGLVSLGIKLVIASSTRSGSVEQPLARAAHQVYTGKLPTPKDLFEHLSPIIPSDEQFRTKFETATVSNTKFARYFLRSLESAERREPEPWFIPNEDAQAITLEHVLPIRPLSNWPQFTSDDVKLFAKRLGNLVLLQARTNSSLGSASFDQKARLFQQSPYGTTRMVGDQNSWSPDAISSRQRVLAGLAVLAWPYPGL